jgi:hypothetical protein
VYKQDKMPYKLEDTINLNMQQPFINFIKEIMLNNNTLNDIDLVLLKMIKMLECLILISKNRKFLL